MSREVCAPSLHEVPARKEPERKQKPPSTQNTGDKIRALKLRLQLHTNKCHAQSAFPNQSLLDNKWQIRYCQTGYFSPQWAGEANSLTAKTAWLFSFKAGQLSGARLGSEVGSVPGPRLPPSAGPEGAPRCVSSPKTLPQSVSQASVKGSPDSIMFCLIRQGHP